MNSVVCALMINRSKQLAACLAGSYREVAKKEIDIRKKHVLQTFPKEENKIIEKNAMLILGGFLD